MWQKSRGRQLAMADRQEAAKRPTEVFLHQKRCERLALTAELQLFSSCLCNIDAAPNGSFSSIKTCNFQPMIIILLYNLIASCSDKRRIAHNMCRTEKPYTLNSRDVIGHNSILFSIE